MLGDGMQFGREILMAIDWFFLSESWLIGNQMFSAYCTQTKSIANFNLIQLFKFDNGSNCKIVFPSSYSRRNIPQNSKHSYKPNHCPTIYVTTNKGRLQKMLVLIHISVNLINGELYLCWIDPICHIL